MTIGKLIVFALLLLLAWRMIRGGESSGKRRGVARGRRAPCGRVEAPRVQCPWCGSWNVSVYRDLRSGMFFLALLTFGLVLLLFPLFPKTNLCNECGRRWSFGRKK
jgi:hypothetical protein